eukprot:364364-Chlamydomonas_euryale.AAC.11
MLKPQRYRCPLVHVGTFEKIKIGTRNKEDRKSRTGYVFTLNGGALAWGSQAQSVVAQSTCEAEYIAAATAAKEALYLKQLMPEFGYDTACIDLAVDNQGAIKVIYGQEGISNRMKHIDVRVL